MTVDALFRQAGVIRADTLGELFDVAALLAGQPLPRGPRVAIVTNAGGPGILVRRRVRRARGSTSPTLSADDAGRAARVRCRPRRPSAIRST